ncbi:MAG: hypothetical protein II987_05010 [Clostridia bacterium]|nr:hypothetical protein [Clostridia bacterium]
MIKGLSTVNIHYLTDDVRKLEQTLNETEKQSEYQTICLALATRNTNECITVLKKQFESSDKRKRFDALYYAFYRPEYRIEHTELLQKMLREALYENNMKDVKCLLCYIGEYELAVDVDLLFDALMYVANYAGSFEYGACLHIPYTEDNFIRILALFKKIKQREKQWLAENIVKRCEEKYFEELVELLMAEPDPRVNFYAVELCAKFKRRDYNERLLAMDNASDAVYGHTKSAVKHFLS